MRKCLKLSKDVVRMLNLKFGEIWLNSTNRCLRIFNEKVIKIESKFCKKKQNLKFGWIMLKGPLGFLMRKCLKLSNDVVRMQNLKFGEIWLNSTKRSLRIFNEKVIKIESKCCKKKGKFGWIMSKDLKDF